MKVSVSKTSATGARAVEMTPLRIAPFLADLTNSVNSCRTFSAGHDFGYRKRSYPGCQDEMGGRVAPTHLSKLLLVWCPH